MLAWNRGRAWRKHAQRFKKIVSKLNTMLCQTMTKLAKKKRGEQKVM